MRIDRRLYVSALAIIIGMRFFNAYSEERKPNFVIIMADDQTTDSQLMMPNLQELIHSGTSFENYFVSTPVCAPSRSTLLTGQYAHNSGVRRNKRPRGGYHALDHRNTIAMWLKAAGYHTIFIGKYVNQYGQGSDPANWTVIPPGWDNWQAFSRKEYAYYDYWINDNSELTYYGDTPMDYQTDVLAERAVRAVHQQAQERMPFLLLVAPLAPHGELAEGIWRPPRPADRHVTSFADTPLPQLPSFNEPDVSDKPLAISVLPSLSDSSIAHITYRYRAELASLLAVDDLVARLVRQLRIDGILDNTVIIYTSDNGVFHGEHRLPDGKTLLYDEAVRQPLIIRGQEFGKDLRVVFPTTNVDLAATIVDLADVAPTRILDGRSFRTLLRNPDAHKGRAILLENFDDRGRRQTDAIRTRRYFYAEWKHPDSESEYELYDLAADPYQLENRHGDPSLARVEIRLRAKLRNLRNCRGSIQCYVTE